MIDMTEEQMRKEIRRVLRQVGRNAKEIEAAASVSFDIPTYAVEHLKDFRRQIKKISIKRATGRTLRNYYRDINYIAGLKSATVEGAMEMSYGIQPIVRAVKALPEEEEKAFWRVYDKAYSEDALMQHYKYEILDTVYQSMTEGNHIKAKNEADNIGKDIVNLFSKVQLELREYLGREPSEQEIAGIFIERLQQIL